MAYTFERRVSYYPSDPETLIYPSGDMYTRDPTGTVLIRKTGFPDANDNPELNYLYVPHDRTRTYLPGPTPIHGPFKKMYRRFHAKRPYYPLDPEIVGVHIMNIGY